MVRLSALATLLLCVAFPSNGISEPSAKEVEVNGVRLQYVEQGSGEPIVFIHGALSDFRVWEPIREEFAKSYRYIAYSRRYHGVGAWTDDGKEYSVATHVNDLAKFITSLNAGPVHLVGRSSGAVVATNAALKHPSLVLTLTAYEPPILSVLPAESENGKAARDDSARTRAAAVAANKTGDTLQAARLFIEGVYELAPGGFDRLPQTTQAMVIDNARTLPPAFAAPPPPAVTCDTLKNLSRPTLVMRGEKTRTQFALVSDEISKCVPGAQRVVLPNANHNATGDPAAFSAAVLEFLSKR